MTLDRNDRAALRLAGRKERQRARRRENDLRFALSRGERFPRLRLVPPAEIPRRP